MLTLKHATIPPQAHFSKENPLIDFKSAKLFVPSSPQKLTSKKALLGGVSAFGLSGINAHVILEEAKKTVAKKRETSIKNTNKYFTVFLSASSENSLYNYAQNILNKLKSTFYDIDDIAYTLAYGRDYLAYRIAFAVQNLDDLMHELKNFVYNENQIKLDAVKNLSGSAEKKAHLQLEHEDKSQAKKTCEDFINGAIPASCKQVFARVHLPAVPFEKKRVWPYFAEFLSKQNKERNWAKNYSNDFMSEQIREQAFDFIATKIDKDFHFALPIQNKAFWPFYEHTFKKTPVLVGMAFPALIALADKTIRKMYLSLEITDLTWQKPFIEGSFDYASLIRQKNNDESYTVNLKGYLAEDSSIYSSASYEIIHLKEEMSKKDISSLTLNMTQVDLNTLKLDNQSSESKVSGLEVSNRWDIRTSLYFSKDKQRAVSKLELDNKYLSDFETFAYHPAMLDVAVSSLLSSTPFLPASCKRIKLYSPLTKVIWVECVEKFRQDKKLVIDCFIYNKEGSLLVSFEELMFLAPASSKPLLHKLEWEQIEFTRNKAVEPYIIFKYNSENLIQRLEEEKSRHILSLLPNTLTAWNYALHLQKLIKNISKLRHTKHLYYTAIAQKNNPYHAAVRGLLMSLSYEESRFKPLFLECEENISTSEIDEILQTVSLEKADELDIPWLCYTADKHILKPVLSKNILIKQSFTNEFENTCLLLTGGFGGIALTLAEQIGHLFKHVILLHKSPLTNTHLLDKLKNSNIKYTHFLCDVTDEEALFKTLEKARQECGELGVIVHCAGVAGSGFLVKKQKNDFDKVFDVKVRGAELLYQLTLQDNLKYFVLSSSRTAILSAAGQSDYTAANATLDLLAQKFTQLGTPTLSLAWNTWAKTGMAAKAGIEERHMLLPEQAGELFLDALASYEKHKQSNLFVMMEDEFISHKNNVQKVENHGESLQEKLSSLQIEDTELAVLLVISNVLEDDKVNAHDDYFNIGGDSISGTRIASILNTAYTINISVADLLGANLIQDFVDIVYKSKGSKQQEYSR